MEIRSNQVYFKELIRNSNIAQLGNLFGKPCGKIGKKAFVVFYENDMVFKLGRDRIASLLKKYPGAKNFDPSGKGRPMKDWLQVSDQYRLEWKCLFEEAMEFVLE